MREKKQKTIDTGRQDKSLKNNEPGSSLPTSNLRKTGKNGYDAMMQNDGGNFFALSAFANPAQYKAFCL